VVLTGGAAQMHGMLEIAEDIFQMPVRLGTPVYADGNGREIGLTERGRAARVPLTRIATEFLEEVFDGISGPQLEAFGRILDHIVERFDSRSANTDDRDTSSRSNHRTRTKIGSKHVEGSGRPRHRL
jgi:cell division ATPase FtsA